MGLYRVGKEGARWCGFVFRFGVFYYFFWVEEEFIVGF